MVTSPQGELTPFGLVPKYSRFRVVGIFNSGFYEYDSSWAFTRLSDAQSLVGLGDQISVLEFKVDDIYQAGRFRGSWKGGGKGFHGHQLDGAEQSAVPRLRLERLVTFITIGLIVFVAALNILISLTMMVMEKTRDIAVLMSMGRGDRRCEDFHCAGSADRSDRDGDRAGPGLRVVLGGRPLSSAVAVS